MNNVLLEKYLQYVFQNVPYYRENIDKDIQSHPIELFNKIPILNKQDVLSKEALFLSDRYKYDFYSGRLLKKHTSGSTGTCLNVYWSLSDDVMSNLTAWKYRQRWYNVEPADKFLSFHTSIYRKNHFMEDPDKILYSDANISVNKLYLNNDQLKDIMDEINQFDPIWILVQPSVLDIFVKRLIHYKEERFFKRIKYIELNGEYLQEGMRDNFQKYFPNAKIANMYGAMEVGTIALECPCGNMHVLSNNVYVEVMDSIEENPPIRNQVLITSLKNTVMPFIRYSIGDRAALLNRKCKCGCNEPIIQLIAGRIGQNIILPSGEEIPSYTILFAIERINAEYGSPVIQFKAVQKSNDTVYVYLELKDDFKKWLPAIETTFNDCMSKYLGNSITWKLDTYANYSADLSMKNQFFELAEEAEV